MMDRSELLVRLCPDRGTKGRPSKDAGMIATHVVLSSLDGFNSTLENEANLAASVSRACGVAHRDSLPLTCLAVCRKVGLLVPNVTDDIPKPRVPISFLKTNRELEQTVRRSVRYATEPTADEKLLLLRTSSKQKQVFNELDVLLSKSQELYQLKAQLLETEVQLLKKIFGDNVAKVHCEATRPNHETVFKLLPIELERDIITKANSRSLSNISSSDLVGEPGDWSTISSAQRISVAVDHVMNAHSKLFAEERGSSKSRSAVAVPAADESSLTLVDTFTNDAVAGFTPVPNSKSKAVKRLEPLDKLTSYNGELGGGAMITQPLDFSDVVVQFKTNKDECVASPTARSPRYSISVDLESELLLPSWRIHDWTTDIELTDIEDFSDEAYLRRHDVALKFAKQEWEAIQLDKERLKREERDRRLVIKSKSPRKKSSDILIPTVDGLKDGLRKRPVTIVVDPVETRSGKARKVEPVTVRTSPRRK